MWYCSGGEVRGDIASCLLMGMRRAGEGSLNWMAIIDNCVAED